MVRGRIKKVHAKGFAFAQTSQGDVFIPPKTYEALGCPSKGSHVELTVKRGPKGLIAQEPITRSSVEWNASWQVGAEAIKLPNTRALSKHTITFGCFQCGSEIVADEDVYKIQNSAIWTHALPASLKEGKAFFNRHKNVHAYSANCRKCNFSLGTIYPERYQDAEPEKLFPCAKLTYVRERRSDDALLHSLVVLAESEQAAEIAMSRLVLADDEVTMPTSNVRVTSHTWELMQQVSEAKKSTQSAEIRAVEAEARELQVLSVLDKEEDDKARAYKKAKQAQELARKATGECRAEQQRASERLRAVQAERSSVEEKLREVQTGSIFVTAQKNSLAVHVQDLAQEMQRLSTERDALQTTIQQKDEEIHDREEQCRHHDMALARLVQAPSVAKDWAIPGIALEDGTMKYEICREHLRSGADTREQDEFNFAFGQMLRLQADNQNIRVKRVVVYENPLVATLYESKKQAMLRQGACKELWVFHGTAEQNIDKIMTAGFKVGGDTVPVQNGAAHGRGVYTATGPMTPMQYSNSGGGNAVVLSKALEGTRGRQEQDDCWVPRGDWLIFKSGEQLLPTYAVHW